MADMEKGKPKEGGTAPWKPLTYEPVIARASVRLRLVKIFRCTAESWEKKWELPRSRADDWLSNEIRAFEKTLGFAGIGPGQDPISRLWGNTYGIKNVDKATPEQAEMALAYVDSVFKPVIGKAALAVQEGMAEFVIGVGPKATALEQLNKFRKHYEGLVEALRVCEPDEVDACAMIAHYDDWVVSLVDLVNDGSGNRRQLRQDDKLADLVDRALESKAAQRKATKQRTGSPIVDVHNFYTLTNELQSLCSSAFLRKDSQRELAEQAKLSLARREQSEKYFEKVDRLLEIVDDDRRVDEAFHGLVVAATLEREDRMRFYGARMVRGSRRVLRYHYKGKNPEWQHPVLLMTAKLFQGDAIPIELPQLQTYFQGGHHVAVLAAESNLKAAAFQPLIDAVWKPRAASGGVCDYAESQAGSA